MKERINSLPTDILILRRRDMLPWARPLPLRDMRPEHFMDLKAIQQTRNVLVVAGPRQKVLKGVTSPTKASYASRHNSAAQEVIGGHLVTVFRVDPVTGVPSGVLVCPPWTQADSDETSVDADVMGMTVTREGSTGTYVLFHDQGLFIPTPNVHERES